MDFAIHLIGSGVSAVLKDLIEKHETREINIALVAGVRQTQNFHTNEYFATENETYSSEERAGLTLSVPACMRSAPEEEHCRALTASAD
jgi:hypothetical protein